MYFLQGFLYSVSGKHLIPMVVLQANKIIHEGTMLSEKSHKNVKAFRKYLFLIIDFRILQITIACCFLFWQKDTLVK